jgi:hypothetical protein
MAARGVITPVAGANQVPASYTGGEAIPEAVSSISNLRTIIQKIYDRPLSLSATTSVEVPNVGYAKCYRVVISGVLAVAVGTGSVTAGDPRRIIANINFQVQSATRLHTLPGIAENILNLIDNQVLNNKQTFAVANGNNTFYMEYIVWLPHTEANLGGIIYKGGGSTYPTLEMTTRAVTDILTLTGNATASFSSLNVQIYEERIDAEAPRNPERVVVREGGNEVERIIPGRGLWEETSRFIETGEDRIERVGGPNQEISVDLQLGQPYLRIILIGYKNGQIDSLDDIVSSYALRLENTTTIWDIDTQHSDRIFRELYYKQRPGGVHSLSFVDRTASDRDIMYTRDLGRFELIFRTGPNTPSNDPANNYVQIITQKLRRLDAAAMY